MGSFRKTDNKVLDHKLILRLHVLTLAGVKAARVLDLCAGEGHIWSAMRERVKVVAYTPCDKAPRLYGTIKGDIHNRRFLESFDLDAFNVIDIDTYGEPWEPWSVVAPRIKKRTAVFLTCGTVSARERSGPNLSRHARVAMGIPPDWKCPKRDELNTFAAEYCLNSSAKDVTLVSAWRIRPDANVTYYGLVVDARR